VLRDVLPTLRPAVEQWWAALPGESPTPAPPAEVDLVATRASLQDTDARLQIVTSERDGAYRAALVATFDRDAMVDLARSDLKTMEHEQARLRGRLDTLRASRGVRWL